MNAILALEDGSWYKGVSAGATGETSGEVVFNTSMTGYQEVLTDPSYAGQIVTMTAPQIGNYGVAAADHESDAPARRRLRRARSVADCQQLALAVDPARLPDQARHRRDRRHRHARADPQAALGWRDARRHRDRRGRSIRTNWWPRRAPIPKMEGADLVKDVTCAAAYDFSPSLADAVAEATFGVAPLKRAQRAVARRRLRLRHQDQHPAPAGRTRLRRARLSGIGAGLRAARDRSGRHLPQQRSGRSGGRDLRHRQRPDARRQRRVGRSSGSAWAISCLASRSVPTPTS